MDTPRLHALAARHAELDRRIEEETHRPSPDMTALASLKKQKLKIKEEIVLH